MDLFFLLGEAVVAEDVESFLLFSETPSLDVAALSEAMTHYLSRFVHTSNPNGGGRGFPDWATWSGESDIRKRMVFDSPGPYVSREMREPQEQEKYDLSYTFTKIQELIQAMMLDDLFPVFPEAGPNVAETR